MKRLFVILFGIFCVTMMVTAQEYTKSYLDLIKQDLNKKWPHNKTINIVFHGHSVPSGYFNTPVVNTLSAYPHLVFHEVKVAYPYAVVNVITTSIGGEQAEQGEKRFRKEVLSHRPDVLFIDYALNDRSIGIERSEQAWRRMIKKSINKGIRIVLLTPTPDTKEDINDPNAPLSKHAEMIRLLAAEYHVGLVDSYKAFQRIVQSGKKLSDYMSQNNHINKKGHSIVAAEVMNYFK